MHTDVAQTAELHAIPAFASWARARGIRPWDVVECGWYEPAGPLLVLYTDEDGDCWLYDNEGRCVGHGRPADCRLMASESDLMDYAETLGVVVIEYDGMGSWVANINCTASRQANTPLAALYAALMGGE